MGSVISVPCSSSKHRQAPSNHVSIDLSYLRVLGHQERSRRGTDGKVWSMYIAILAFNKLDLFIALGILNRIKPPDWQITLACSAPRR